MVSPAHLTSIGMTPRLLVFIPAYNATSTIGWVLSRIPDTLTERFDVHVLVIDDASADDTADKAREYLADHERPFGYTILVNPQNRGYGGNQKLGYTFAVEHGFDLVAMVHGDGQYPPEAIEELVAPLRDPAVGAGFGSRFMREDGARDGGMPGYKRVGNRILTRLQNRILRTGLSEFHSGFRAYSVPALGEIPFHLNSDDFHFDTEIIIQLVRSGLRIAEIDIPTYYGDEVCHVNGVSYGINVLGQSVRAMVHDKGMFYEAKYDVAPTAHTVERYQQKTDFVSPTTLAVDRIGPGNRVLDLGSGTGGLADLLTGRDPGCQVFGADMATPPNLERFAHFWIHDLDGKAALPEEVPAVDSIVMLDVIEHLRNPERFVSQIADYCTTTGSVDKVLVSTGNIGFGLIRLALLFGQFNYGSRGILDRTHTRLFTYGSFRRLFTQAGFEVVDAVGVPAPFPLAVGNRRLADALLGINQLLIGINRRFFAYQIFLEMRPPVAQSRLLAATTDVSSPADR